MTLRLRARWRLRRILRQRIRRLAWAYDAWLITSGDPAHWAGLAAQARSPCKTQP